MGPATGCWDCGGAHFRGAPECPAAHQARSLEETEREVKSLCTLTHHQERTVASDQTQKKSKHNSKENHTEREKGNKGVRGNMFKLLEAESDDEENDEVKEALDPCRFGEDTEWTEVAPKKVSKQTQQDKEKPDMSQK